MKKKIIAIVAVFAVIALMYVAYGCGKSKLEPEAPVTISASASQTTESNFNFELIYADNDSGLYIYHEKTTDTLFLQYGGYKAGGITQLMDPETGLPLTYTVWQEKY